MMNGFLLSADLDSSIVHANMLIYVDDFSMSVAGASISTAEVSG
jgi:hypothetical protein